MTIRRDPVWVANNILDELGVSKEDLQHYLVQIVRQRGALVVEDHLDGSEARINLAGKPAIITISTGIEDTRRKRFSVAHELGHLELHRYVFTLCTHEDINSWYVQKASRSYEHEASEFAAAFLMPERYFSDLCEDEPSLDYIAELAHSFGTSLTATSKRYARFTPEPVAIVFSEDGYIKWFDRSKEFEEMGLFVDIHSRLTPDTRASLFFQGQAIPKPSKPVGISSWCKSGDYSEDAILKEQSWVVTENGMLTLLWIDPDLNDDFDYW